MPFFFGRTEAARSNNLASHLAHVPAQPALGLPVSRVDAGSSSRTCANQTVLDPVPIARNGTGSSAARRNEARPKSAKRVAIVSNVRRHWGEDSRHSRWECKIRSAWNDLPGIRLLTRFATSVGAGSGARSGGT